MVFVFCFNLALSTVANLGILAWRTHTGVNFNVPEPEELEVRGGSLDIMSFGNILAAISTLIKVFVDATVGVYWMMIRLGVPQIIATPISAIIYLLYAVFFAQLLGKISLAGGE